MTLPPPISTLTDTLFPYTTLFRSRDGHHQHRALGASVRALSACDHGLAADARRRSRPEKPRGRRPSHGEPDHRSHRSARPPVEHRLRAGRSHRAVTPPPQRADRAQITGFPLQYLVLLRTQEPRIAHAAVRDSGPMLSPENFNRITRKRLLAA